jgi:hypothetical protein
MQMCDLLVTVKAGNRLLQKERTIKGTSALFDVHVSALINKSLHFFPMMQQPLVGKDFLSVEAFRSHSDTPQSVGLLWTSDQPVAEIYT